MRSLQDCVYESLSDSSLEYILGIRLLSTILDVKRVRRMVQKYDIDQNNPRPGILRFFKGFSVPIIPASQEIIPRDRWDLKSLSGETEEQLMHPDYYTAMEHIFKNYRPEHDILTIFQCSAKKPYSENWTYRTRYMKWWEDESDFAAISNPGVILYNYSDRYPYRYDEWSHMAERKLEDSVVDLVHKYRVVNVCRLLRFQREMKYKHIVGLIAHPANTWIFNEIIKKNLEGGKDWLHLVPSYRIRKKIENSDTGKSLGGLLMSRILNMNDMRNAYARTMHKLTNNDELYNDYKDSLVKESSSEILETLSYDEVIKAFKDQYKYEKEPDQFYKSRYWTVLDLVLLGLNGNYIKDIDEVYWDVFNHLKEDPDWEHLDNFLFIYKPSQKENSISKKDMKDEALKLKITRPEPDLYKLPDKIFK